jgi:hypothetical protein
MLSARNGQTFGRQLLDLVVCGSVLNRRSHYIQPESYYIDGGFLPEVDLHSKRVPDRVSHEIKYTCNGTILTSSNHP